MPSAQNDADWTKPCPAPLRCPDRKFCPRACQEAGSREDANHRPEPYILPPG